MKTQSKRTDQKDSSNQVKRQQQILRTAKGSVLIGSGVSGGIGAVRSGLPRALGARLEQHGTSRKAAKNIIKEGYLDPGYGGAEGGVTKSMMLPKEFLERAKGYSFISGKNSDHPFHSERNFLSPLADVVSRKIQVAGYKGSKAGKIKQFHLDLGRHFIGGILALPMKALETVSKNMTLENYEKTLHQMAQAGDRHAIRILELAKTNPRVLKKNFISEKKYLMEARAAYRSFKKQSFNDKGRVKRIRNVQKRIIKLMNEKNSNGTSLHDDYKKWRNEYGLKPGETFHQRKYIEHSREKEKIYSKKLSRKDDFDQFLSEQTAFEPDHLKGLSRDQLKQKAKIASRVQKLKSALNQQLRIQEKAKEIGLSGAWTAKIATSPPLGMLGVGKTLYIPGTDEYFNSDRFKYDPDDPFGNPLKMQQSMTSEKGGFGGNALKTKEKVRAFGDRFSATKYLIEKEGEGNLVRGAKKLIAANPKRALAGLAILGIGGASSALLINKGIKLLKGGGDQKQQRKSHQQQIKVKSSSRKGKLIKGYTRKNPFFKFSVSPLAIFKKKLPKLGTGKRFSNLTKSLEKNGHDADSARRIAASIGRKKYGNRMNKFANRNRRS